MKLYRKEYQQIFHVKSADELRSLVASGIPVDAQDICGNTLLFLTTNPEIARTAIELGADVNARNSGNETPLFTQSCDEIIRLLIDAGADVNALKNEHEYCIDPYPISNRKLSTAAFEMMLNAGAHLYHGILECAMEDDENVDKARLLIDAGVDVNQSKEQLGNTEIYLPLNGAKSPKMVKLLLDAGANAQHIVEGMTCFFTVRMEKNSSERMMLLLKAGADATRPTPDNRTTMMLARDAYVIEALIEAGVNPLTVSDRGETALMHDMTAEAVRLLLKTPIDPKAVDRDGRNALFFVRNAEALRLLIDAGADVNLHDTLTSDESRPSYDRAGGTPLFHIQNAAAAQVLIDAGADVNARNADARTPLFYAPDLETMRVLINAGADVNALDRFGNNAAMEYLDGYYKNIDVEVVKLLVNSGLNLYHQINGNTLLHLTNNANVAQFLIQQGLDVHARNDENSTPLICKAGFDEVVKVLLDAGADVKAMNDAGMTALETASKEINEKSVRLLIDAGADVNAAHPADNHTVLTTAVINSSPCIIEMLVMAGAEIDTPLNEQSRNDQKLNKPDEGWTPLMHCSWRSESALALIALGANVNARDSQLRTPLMHLYNDDAVVEALINAGADVNAVDINGRTIFDYIGRDCSPKTRQRLMDARG